MNSFFYFFKKLFNKKDIDMDSSFVVFRYLHDNDGFPIFDFITHFPSIGEAKTFAISNGYVNMKDITRDELVLSFDNSQYIDSYVIANCRMGDVFGKEEEYVVLTRRAK